MVSNLLASKWFHTLLVTVLVAVLLFGSFDQLASPYSDFGALGPIIAWMLGVQYERSIVLEAGLVDDEDLKRVERRSATFFRTRE